MGRAVDLRRRVTSYWSKAPEERGLTRMVARIARVEALPCDSAHEAAWLERNLLERSRPTYNRSLGGQEVPVWMAVDAGPRRLGIRLLHAHETPVERFGPYLGGDRARLAIDGLRRAAPLHLAGDGLTGSERAMAAALGVHPTDRERLLVLVRGVLSRVPGAVAAVVAELERRQAVAVDRLDFEAAARIRDELVGVRWVGEPQRVIDTEPADGTLAGWSGGRLVLLTVRTGRVDGWTERPATATAAARWLKATPDAWRPFLDRAATLAARLASAGG